jgi:hypothetical protein
MLFLPAKISHIDDLWAKNVAQTRAFNSFSISATKYFHDVPEDTKAACCIRIDRQLTGFSPVNSTSIWLVSIFDGRINIDIDVSFELSYW